MDELLRVRNGRVRIYLGIDAITNMDSIVAMQDYMARYGASLTCRVVLHNVDSVIFHPKVYVVAQ